MPKTAETTYKELFLSHHHNLLILESKLRELEEFTRQWDKVFDLLAKETGQSNCQIRVQNLVLYRTYIYDKFHVFLSDFYTLLSGQLIDHYTVVKAARKNLIRTDRKGHDSRPPQISMELNSLKSQQVRKRSEELETLANENAENQKFEQLRLLFPNIVNGAEISELDQKDLKEQIKLLSSRLQGARHLYNHKHEKIISDKYKRKGDLPNLQELRDLLDKYCDLIHAIGISHHGVSYTFHFLENYEQLISDVIDIVLFGSIGRALSRFEMTEDGEHQSLSYGEAREIFFASSKIKSLIFE